MDLHDLGDYERIERLGQLVFSGWSRVMVHVKRVLSENPDQHLNEAAC